MIALFEKHTELRVKSPYVTPTYRRDLRAFTLLDKLVPGMMDIVSAAEHDIIYLDTSVEELAKVASEEDIAILAQCGVMCDDDGLSMFA